MPFALNPFSWGGVVETQSFYAEVPIDSRSTDIDQLNRAQIFYKPAQTPVTLAAKRSPLGRVYLDWARFPLVETETRPASAGADHAVQFRDLRFDYLGNFLSQPNGRRPLSAEVVLDRNLHVVVMRVGDREQKP
jgi:inner membrane protein